MQTDAAAEVALEEGGKLGLESLEVLIKGGRNLAIKVFDGAVDEFSSSETGGLSVRALRGGQEGYAYSEDLGPEAVRATVRAAAENALLVADPEPVTSAGFRGAEHALGLFSPALEELPVADKIALALASDAATRAASEEVLTVPQVGYAEGTAFQRLVSSGGLDARYRVSSAFIYTIPLVGRGEQKKTALEFRRSRDGAGLDPEEMARTAVARARGLLDARSLKSGSYPVVFENRVATKLLEAFGRMFSAQAAQEGHSVLGPGRVGETIAAPHVTVVDDPLRPGGWASRPFDDEGCPSRLLALIEDGVFQSHLHNAKTARRAGATSTGHASRSVRGTLGVAASNLYVRPGESSPASLRAAHPQAVEIVEIEGLHAGTQLASGDFSAPCKGYWLEAGERRQALENFTVSGNILTTLAGLEAVADDLYFGLSGVGSPSWLVSSLSIGGSG